MNKAIIIGASSGIGRELAKILSYNKYTLGLTARREYLLKELQEELSTPVHIRQMDISMPDVAMSQLKELIIEMNGVDLIIVSSGIGHINKTLDWSIEKETIDVNVTGATAMMNVSIEYFKEKNAGHLVVISSIAALRGSSEGPAYNASKAFVSNYLEGLRCLVKKTTKKITITDIRPGLVDTDMAKGDGLFWVQTPEKAAGQIYKSIKRKKDIVYITKRWRFIALILKYLPKWIYYKIG